MKEQHTKETLPKAPKGFAQLRTLTLDWMRSTGPLSFEDVEIDAYMEQVRAYLTLLLCAGDHGLEELLREDGMRTLQCLLCPMEDLLEVKCGDTEDTFLLRNIHALLQRMMVL